MSNEPTTIDASVMGITPSEPYGVDDLIIRIEGKFILELGTVVAPKGFVRGGEYPNIPFLKLRYILSKEIGLHVVGSMPLIIFIANTWLDTALSGLE